MFKKNNIPSFFQNENSLEDRIQESSMLLLKYPNRIPIIVDRFNNEIEDIDKKKYLVPKDLTMGQFIHVIRQRMKLEPDKALYLFVDKIIPTSSELVSNIYDSYKNKDGFLYVKYCGESTFG